MSEVRLLDLSPARQTLIRVMQAINFGALQHIQVRDGNPVLDGDSVASLDIKLDKEDDGRPESELTDFVLAAEVVRLMRKLDQLKNGTITCLEVRAGIPRRMAFESRVGEMLGVCTVAANQ